MSRIVFSDLRLTPCSHPSQGILTVGEHFVLLKARYGRAWIFEEMCYLLNQIEEVQGTLDRNNELLKIRGLWHDDKNGCLTAYLQLLYDRGHKPTLNMERLKGILGDDLAGISLFLMLEVVEDRFVSDSFFSVSDEYYSAVRAELRWVV